MKRTFRNISSLLLAVVMILSLSVTAFADDSTITFKGLKQGFDFQPGSKYTATDLFDNFKNVMPGDNLTETITVKNDADDCDYIKVYIRAEVHDEETNPLSPNVAASGETVATMTDFLQQLYMTVNNGEEQIYAASPDELDGFAEPVYLGTIRSGQTISLDVTLTVPIDMGNEYANRVGEVDWVFLVEAFDNPTPPPITHEQLTVRKVWDDDGIDRPNSVKVNLLRNGKVVDTVTLNAKNQWTYTWNRLDDDYNWTVEEAEVPEGYIVSYRTVGSTTTITNTQEILPPPPASYETLTVVKVWEGNSEAHPDNATVNLLRNGKTVQTVVLNVDNDWTYTWDELDDEYVWSAEEAEVPEGYKVSYHADDDTITIINTFIPVDISVEPVNLTVVKTWSGDEEQIKKRPESVSVTLYNGEEAIETVWLGEWNNWSYTWRELDGNGNWSVLENIPEGYTPHYSVSGETVTITNMANLIQTGQLNWPIPVFGGLGVIILGIGVVLLLKKKESDHA